MKREEIKKPDYTAGIRHTTVGSDRHDVRREDFRNKTVRTAKRRSGLIGRLFACSATLALAFGACTDDAPVEQPKSGGVDLTCIVESDLTAALGSSTDNRHPWESGDRIGVYAVSSAPTLNAEASVTTNDGTSSIAFHVNRAETGDKLHAYFPYTKDNSSNDAKNVALSIAAVQSQSEAGAFDIANLPMVSYPQRLDAESLSEIPALQMHVLGGILRAKVFADGQYGDEKVQSIAFADENTPMAGAFKLDLTGLSDEASLIVTGLASRTAKTQLSIPYAVPSSQESAKDIYMILAPGTYDGTLSVTTEKAVYTQPFQCEMKRNACYDASINLSTAARESIDGWNGEGTAEAPYQVATAEDLQRLIALCNSDGGEYAEFADKHYLQIADIDMAQIAIQPIGLSEQSPFRGVYDGGGHTIGNFTLTNCESGACGLFGYLDGATVKDIHLEECEYSASGLHAGGVAGVAKQSVIRGCTFEGSLVGTAETEFDGYAVSDVGGIIGYALDSEIAGCTLKGSIRALAQIGGMAGYTSGTKISDCTVDAAATIDAETHFLGGIVGRARHNSTIENCTVGGKASAYNGNYVGGIAGHLTSGKISGCTIAASASLSSKGDHTGGIVGALQANEENADDGSNMTAVVEDCETDIMVFGADNVGGIAGYQGTATAEHTSIVRNCTSRESVTGYGYNTGGISGSITSYGDSFIENCQAYGDVSSSLHQVGGIVGYIVSKGETAVDGCIAYGNCRGQHSVGGICGYAKCNDAACIVDIVNSIYAGREVEATGNNGSNGYTLATGLVGWLQVGTGKAHIVNCASRVQTVKTVGKAGGYPSANNTLSGILGFQNGSPTAAELYGLYSTIGRNGFLTDGEPSTSIYCGGIYAKIHSGSYTITSLKHCYFDPSTQAGPGISNLTKADAATVKAYGEMSTLLADLNAAVAAYEGTCGRTLKNWTLDADGYPVIEGMTTLLPVSKTKRISVIGDSISTFRGFVPSGYSCHYPTSDHDLTSVSQTYWYRLAHDLMSDARIERNISFSGTAVARTTDPAYASQAWYGNDFCARFIAQGGVGQPDIVLIHGGTNDYAHNVDPLAPGLPIQSAEAPSEAALAELFAAADAAATRAEIEALDDTTFCTAYIKLLRLLKERYPDVKIVCIIGDYLSTGIERSTLAIARHYGARCVDLYAVNGFNDQTYMPKHDYNPATGKGCHPSSEAMKFIADKIYAELGSWLEE